MSIFELSMLDWNHFRVHFVKPLLLQKAIVNNIWPLVKINKIFKKISKNFQFFFVQNKLYFRHLHLVHSGNNPTVVLGAGWNHFRVHFVKPLLLQKAIVNNIWPLVKINKFSKKFKNFVQNKLYILGIYTPCTVGITQQ